MVRQQQPYETHESDSEPHSKLPTILLWIVLLTIGWPFAILYLAFGRYVGFSQERYERRVSNSAVRPCPKCERVVSVTAPVCPRCEYRFKPYGSQ